MTSDDVRLNYVDEGSGTPVVLIAGHTAPLGSWQPLAAVLLEAGYRVIRVDRRHTGASDFPDHGLRMARQGADLHEFLVGMDLDETVALVGSSMAVSAIWSMIDTFGTVGLAALVLVDQTPKMINVDGWELGMYDLTPADVEDFLTMFGTPQAQTAGRYLRPSGCVPDAELMPILVELAGQSYPHDEVRPLLRDHAHADWRDVLPRIDVPTLAVGGRHSELWPVEHAGYVARHVQDGELLVLEESGHMPFWTEPKTFNAAVVGFLAGHDGGGSRST